MRLIVFAFIAVILLASTARACTNPAGIEQAIIFNDTHNVYQYCDGTNWIAMIGSDPKACPIGISSCGGKPTERVAFNTSASTMGGVGGIAGADAMCNDLASAAGLHGTYFAWLSNSYLNNMPAIRFEQASVPYVRTDGAIIANDWADLTDGTINVTLNVNENGVSTANGAVWTNTNADGTINDLADHCGDFFNDFGISYGGNRNATNSQWTQSGALACNTARRLYCFEQGHIQQTQIVPNGLVGHWRLDETSGTTAYDSSGNGNNGTISSNYTLGSSISKINKSAYLTDAIISVSNSSSLENIFDGGGAITAWILDESTNQFPRIVSKTSDQNWPEGYTFYIFQNSRLTFSHRFDGNGGQWVTAEGTLPSGNGQWKHVAVVYDNSSDANDPTLYINGEAQIVTESFSPSGTRVSDATESMSIGDTPNRIRHFTGNMDDIRVYNRALSAAEIKEIYEARDGIRYNESRRVPEFFDGNRFVAMTPAWPEPNPDPQGAGYAPKAVSFDGATRLDGTSAGVNNETQITLSTWVRFNSIGAWQDIFENNAGNLWLRLDTSGEIAFRIENSTNDPIIGSSNPNMTLSTGIWYHLLLSVDTAAQNYHFYINDSDVTPAGHTWPNPGPINLLTDYYVGGQGGTPDYLDGDMAELWFATGTYLDFSAEANRRKFIDGSGNPVFLGADGSLPTGSQPDFFLSGDTVSWHTNKGSESGFNEDGTLTTAQGPNATSLGLIGHWKLDETSGTTAVDSSGNGNDGTMQGGMTAADDTQPGAVGTSLAFDGVDDYINVPHDASLTPTNNELSVSFWVRPDVDWDDETDQVWYLIGKYENSNDLGWHIGVSGFNSENLRVQLGKGGGSFTTIDTPGLDWERSQWYHIALVLQLDGAGTTYSWYRDGVLLRNDTSTGVNSANIIWGTEDLWLGDSVINNRLNGALDDIRVYDRALTASEVVQLYQMGAPVGQNTALPQGCPNIGDVCDDGTIYAGLSPDGNIEMFVAPMDLGSSPWNNGNASDFVLTGVGGNTGEANTLALVQTDSDSASAGFQTHQAAQLCYDMAANGTDDWYLPSGIEASLMWDNLVDEDGDSDPNTPNPITKFGFEDSRYWTSSEFDSNTASRLRIDTGGTGGSNKDMFWRVRCIRKGPAPRCANPYGLEGSMIYNTTHDVVQYCDGARWIAIGKRAP